KLMDFRKELLAITFETSVVATFSHFFDLPVLKDYVEFQEEVVTLYPENNATIEFIENLVLSNLHSNLALLYSGQLRRVSRPLTVWGKAVNHLKLATKISMQTHAIEVPLRA